MARLANFNGVSETLPGISKLPSIRRTQKRVKVIGFLGKKTDDDSQQQSLQTTRRLALGLASITLVGNTCDGVSLAENNGFWIDGPLPVPSVDNNIVNEKTGTRSFLKKGLYIADIPTKGRMFRLRKCAFDLLAMEDLIGQGQDLLNYVQKYLRLKSTFMYYDFDKVITAAAADEKQPLTTLANKFFDNVEKLDGAVKQRNLLQTETIYKDTKVILQESGYISMELATRSLEVVPALSKIINAAKRFRSNSKLLVVVEAEVSLLLCKQADAMERLQHSAFKAKREVELWLESVETLKLIFRS
ncbi:hypothetical protein FNV43_RR03977 [Rhamnella rubrinervis]|uniref:Uncharacterized protein n=1 Tax=Rhamnella rubrinervis TaxID=2594499 RepID=A0A8K0HIY2_9ROSA|nr:hypothetical protein FNV43_RR03977 [Rhamnella rubrinervis]